MIIKRRMTFFLIFVAVELDFSTAELRWCANGSIEEDYSSSENATQYDDELYACVECTQRAKLVLRDEMYRNECCNGGIAPVGTCGAESLLHSCNVQRNKCDGIRQCYDGLDEMGCYGCSNDTFGCNDPNEGPQCLPVDKLCDSVKDCRDGTDEIFCPYYGGRCDGYLCGAKHPKCISYEQICDRAKDCLDGSDESNCQYCPNQFRCRVEYNEEIGTTSAECVARFRVCNGIPDCINSVDELRCHRWQDWGRWSVCGTATEACTRIRRRLCVNYVGAVINSSGCYGTDSNGLNENHIDICPECLINAIAPSTAATTDLKYSTTDEGFSGTSSTVPIRNAGSANLSFDSGAQIGVAVAVSLVVVAIIVSVLIAACKLKHTGFWKPACKSPRPSRSNLPGITIKGRRRIKPINRMSHPYPMREADKVNAPGTIELPHPPPKESAAMSLRCSSANGMDSGIEALGNVGRGSAVARCADMTENAATDGSSDGNIGRTMV